MLYPVRSFGTTELPSTASLPATTQNDAPTREIQRETCKFRSPFVQLSWFNSSFALNLQCLAPSSTTCTHGRANSGEAQTDIYISMFRVQSMFLANL